MPASPPPYPPRPRGREPSTLDQIRDACVRILELAQSADSNAEAAARRASRIEAAIGELASRLGRQTTSLPPSQPASKLSWADDSQRIDLPHAVESVLEDQELETWRARKKFILDIVKVAAGGAGGVGIWELFKWLTHH